MLLRLLSPPLTVAIPPYSCRQTRRFPSIIVVSGHISESLSTASTNLVSSSSTTTLFTTVNSQASLIELGRQIRVRPSPELGLLSLVFILSTAFGAFLCMALISIPTMIAFAKLGASANKLSKVVSVEVPGTLLSFKLSGLEIKRLTQKLASLRQNILGRSSQ